MGRSPMLETALVVVLVLPTGLLTGTALAAETMEADVARMVQIRDQWLQSLRDKRREEDAVEPARDFVLRLAGGVRVPTLDGRLSIPSEERRKAKDVEIRLPRRGGRWLPGRAAVERFDGRRHYVDTTELTLDGQRIGGVLRLVLRLDPQWLLGSTPPRTAAMHRDGESLAGWRADDPVVPLPRVTAYRVALAIEGTGITGAFEGEDMFGRFEGRATGAVNPVGEDLESLAREWKSAEKPQTPRQWAELAGRVYGQVRALDVMGRYGLPWWGEVAEMVRLPSPRWPGDPQPPDGPERVAATREAVRRMADGLETAQAGRDAAALPSWGLSQVEVRPETARALAVRADGAYDLPPALPAAAAWHFIPEWQLAGPFSLDEGWAFHTPFLPETVPIPGTGYEPETDRLLAFYGPEPGTLIRWQPASCDKGVLKPPVWGEAEGEPDDVRAGLRCSRWFALARVYTEQERTVAGVFDFDYRGKLFVNGKLACAADIALESVACLPGSTPEPRAAAAPAWRRVCRLTLRPGVNEFLVSCENLTRDTRFSLFLSGGQDIPVLREVQVHAGWASPCADAIRRVAVGTLEVPVPLEVEPVAGAPAGDPAWSVPGTHGPMQWARLGRLADRSDKEMEPLRDRVLKLRLAVGAELKDGDRTAPFEAVDKALFDAQHGVDFGPVHASRSGTVSYWFVAIRNRFPQAVCPAVAVPGGVQTRLWVSGREIPSEECFRMAPGVYPLLVELREPAPSKDQPPWLRDPAAPVRKALQVSLRAASNPGGENEKNLQRMRNCRLLCQWAVKELPGTPEAAKANLVSAAVESHLRKVAAARAASQAKPPVGFERLPSFRLEHAAREPGDDPEYVYRVQVAHAQAPEEEPLEVRVRIPGNVPVCKGAVVDMGMGKYGIYWNKAWFDELRRLECAMVYVSGGFAGRKDMLFALRDGGPLLTEVLRAAAKDAGRPELPNVPWIPWGLSGAGEAADLLKECSPERLLACIPYHGCKCGLEEPMAEPTAASLEVPVLFIVGGNDMGSIKDIVMMRFLKGRARGEPAAWVREPGAGHVGNGPIPLQGAWIKALMEQRLPADWDPRRGPPKMRVVAERDGCLGNLATGEIGLPAAYKDNPARAAWLPSEEVARMWQAVLLGRRGK